jgi:hypothetical protein
MKTSFFFSPRRRVAAFLETLPLTDRLGPGALLLHDLALIVSGGIGILLGFGLAHGSLFRLHDQSPMEKDSSYLETETLALREVKEMYAQMQKAIELLASKAMALLQGSAILLTLFGVLQIELLKQGQPLWYQSGLVLTIVVYAVTVVLLLLALAPRVYRMALDADWDSLDKAIRNHTLEHAMTQLLSNYLDRIQYNDSIHHRNIQCYKWATRLFGVVVVILVGLSLLAQR